MPQSRVMRHGDLMISLPISELEVKPLDITQKKLPPTPKTNRISVLEDQIEMLKRENQSLRDQVDIWVHQVARDRQVAEASKNLAKEALSSSRQTQAAVVNMKRIEREANKEWEAYITQGDTGRLGSFI
ncbi:hypothetical protein NA56DRAFT_747922 [Hyaloscypha hepaticicola]|uniref:Uncharacterized protein n=1 Tax=Hyaloscypha hepaticicola TaxID=2082293 RepID=A0A2J6Q8T7_9HELO|nr:hypothetical protein NA56DRAFT_747922 [Hyaloscypha hepaticicola]